MPHYFEAVRYFKPGCDEEGKLTTGTVDRTHLKKKKKPWSLHTSYGCTHYKLAHDTTTVLRKRLE